MKPNWFIGLCPDTTEWLAALLVDKPKRVRGFHPNDLHITLAFLGNCSPINAQQTWEHATKIPPHATTIISNQLKPMGNPKRPSALSLTFQQDEIISQWISTYRGALLQQAGARPDNRPPLPHLTIARPQRRITDKQRANAVEWSQSIVVPSIPISFSTMALFTWSVDRKEILFRKVHEMNLPKH